MRWGTYGRPDKPEVTGTVVTVKRDVGLVAGDSLYYRYYVVLGTLAGSRPRPAPWNPRWYWRRSLEAWPTRVSCRSAAIPRRDFAVPAVRVRVPCFALMGVRTACPSLVSPGEGGDGGALPHGRSL